MLRITKLFFDKHSNRVVVNLHGTNLISAQEEPLYFTNKKRYFLINRKEILKLIENSKTKTILFTGGEPLCQKDILDAVYRYLRRRINDIKIIIKTNGTLPPYMVQAKVNYLVEPILANSKKPFEKRLKKHILKIYANRPTEWVFNPIIPEDEKEIEIIKRWVE